MYFKTNCCVITATLSMCAVMAQAAEVSSIATPNKLEKGEQAVSKSQHTPNATSSTTLSTHFELRVQSPPISSKSSPPATPLNSSPSTSSNSNFALLNCHAGSIEGKKVIFCPDKNNSSISLKEVWTWLLSGFALLVSLSNVVYTYRKDRRARMQSINDDFWIRKIISPTVIEPMMESITEAMSAMPDDCNSTKWDPQLYVTYIEKYQVELQKLGASFHMLNLLDKALCTKVIGCLDKIEDTLLDYCGSNGAKTFNAQGLCAKPKDDTLNLIREQLLTALEAIKSFQTSLK